MFRRSVAALFGAVWSCIVLASVVLADGSDVQLKEVVVTATKTEKSLQDVTQSVTVITGDEIRKSGAVTIAEIIQTKVGATVNNTGPLGGLNTVRLRGSSYQQVLVLVDGIRMNSMRDGGFDLSALPVSLDAIERIEIVRGPASALYGADAVGGVVNIITRRPSVPLTTIGGSVGAHGYSDLSLSNSGSQENVYYAIHAEKERSIGYRLNGDLDNRKAGIKLGYALDTASSIEMTEDYLTKDIGVPGQITVSTPNARQFNRDILTSIIYKARLSKEVDLKINAFEQRDTMEFKDPDNFVDSTHKTTSRGSDIQVNWLAGSWNLISAGTEIKRDDLSSTDTGDHAANLTAQYIQDDISLGDSVNLVLGGRHDKHSIYGSKWSPKASARYFMAGSGTTLRASYGKSFRAPTFNDLYWPYTSSAVTDVSSGITTTYITQGNPVLVPETAEEYEGGIEQSFGKGNVLKFTAFRRKVNNLIQWQESFPNATTDQFNPVNVGRARISGYESEAVFAISDSFQWSLNYMRLFPVNELTGERIFSTAAPMPKMQIGSSLRLALDNQIVLALSGRRVKNYVEPGAEKWDYYTVDGKISETYGARKDGQIDVFIGMRNIFNRKYETAKGYPMPTAEVYGGIALEF